MTPPYTPPPGHLIALRLRGPWPAWLARVIKPGAPTVYLRAQDWARMYNDDIRNAVKPKTYTP